MVAPNSKKLRLAFPHTLLDPSAQLQTFEVRSVALTTSVALGVRLTFFAMSSTDALTRFSRTNSNSGATIQRRYRRRRIKPNRV